MENKLYENDMVAEVLETYFSVVKLICLFPKIKKTAVYLVHSHEEQEVDEYAHDMLLTSSLQKHDVSIESVSETSFVLRIGNKSVEYTYTLD